MTESGLNTIERNQALAALERALAPPAYSRTAVEITSAREAATALLKAASYAPGNTYQRAMAVGAIDGMSRYIDTSTSVAQGIADVVRAISFVGEEKAYDSRVISGARTMVKSPENCKKLFKPGLI